MRISLVWSIIFSASLFVFGQKPTSAPQPPPTAPRTPPPSVRITVAPQPPGVGHEFGIPTKADPFTVRSTLIQQYVTPLYRKPTGKELKSLMPDAETMARFAAILQRPNTGIFKIVPDIGCTNNAKVVSANEECLKYGFPGAGNSFSFRTASYRIRHLADITYASGSFYVTGVLMQGLMVDLGDVPLESVTAVAPELALIDDFRPTSDYEEALKADNAFRAGVTKNGLLYRRNLPVDLGHTYVLRTVAYDGKLIRSIKGADYNELDFDKRRDITTAFKVVGADADGNLTIVWMRLASKDAPKINMPKADDAVEASGRAAKSLAGVE